MSYNEDEFVHQPFLDELKKLGWEVIKFDNRFNQTPQDSDRETFKDVVIDKRLKKSLKKINPFLEDDQVDYVIKEIKKYYSNSLIQNNARIHRLLTEGISVDENRQTKEKSPTVKIIDFENIENNDFLAVSELKVKVKGSEEYIYPDIVLFVNGIPLVVVEAKSPKIKNPLQKTFDDLQSYAQIKSKIKKGNKELFFYNLFMVATDTNKANFGTITSKSLEHFYRWADPYPKNLNDLPRKSGSPNDQNRLIYGMLDKKNLLEILHNFTLFRSEPEGVVKVVARYQQFRAVKKAIERLKTGKTPEDRGGLVWHTQGSGKSLTMMFLIKSMYNDFGNYFDDWKIFLINDRNDLESQLYETARKVGIKVDIANSIVALQKSIEDKTTSITMAMIQKFQERDVIKSNFKSNKSEKILVMLDEAHRSIYKSLGAKMKEAMPNATFIGYTGTPVDKSEKMFKHYIDKYTMKESIEDGATLRIVYEGKAHNADIKEGMIVDIFQDTEIDEETDEIKGLHAALKKAYLESEKTIRAKAKDMIEHYLTHVYPNGYKAQIVASSQKAAVKYKKIIDEILREKDVNFKAEVVISGVSGDEEIQKYAKIDKDAIINSFKLRFDEEKDNIKGDIGILIVNNMLLTGFDAPIEQVMYLDRVLKAHNLLQAIARVNRVYDENKSVGFVVDYIGVGNHLKEALDIYEAKEKEDLSTGLWDKEKIVAELKEILKKLEEFVYAQGIDIDDYDAWYELFYDEDVRFEFMLLYKEFKKLLDILYPAEEANEFVKKFKKYSVLYYQAKEYDEENENVIDSNKLQKIVDEYLISKGIEPKIKPLEILSKEFEEALKEKKSLKAKAALIETHLKRYLKINMSLNPTLYSIFLDMLKNILETEKENWELIYQKLEELRKKLKSEEEKTYSGVDKKYKPFINLLSKNIYNKLEDLNEEEQEVIITLTKNIVEIIERETSMQDFWESRPAQNRLKKELQEVLLSKEFFYKGKIKDNYKTIIRELMEITEANYGNSI
jgi:type I restriction enzyme R subunit